MSAGSATPKALLRTLLVSDLVGSTHLVEVLGDEGAARLFLRHDALARRLLLEHEGNEIDKTDGFLLVFRRPISAVLYALDYHRGLKELSRESGVELSARVGIHLGEVVVRQNSPEDVARGAKPVEVEGLAKPLAARLMSLAEGGQTLLTRGAYEMARRAAVDRLGADRPVRWLEHGLYRFKGVDEPVEVFEVGSVGAAPFRAPTGSEKVKAEPGFMTVPIPIRRRSSLLVSMVAIGVLVALAALAWWASRRAQPAPAVSVRVTPFTVDGGWKDMPQLSPEGERVAYLWDGPASDNFDIWVKPLGAGASALRLTEHPGTDSSPVWSPSGRQLAFVRELEDGHGVFLAPAMGGSPRQLAEISTPHYESGVIGPSLAWSPSGAWLAISERPAGGPSRIVRLSVEASSKETITSPPKSSYGDLYPAFSPDGKRLAFVRLGAEFWGNADVWIQNAEGGKPRQLTFGHYDSFLGLAWTPDGDELIFAVGPSNRVFRVPAAGGEPALVAGTGEGVAFPMVRGERMVYTQMRSWNMDLWRIPGPAAPDPEAPRRRLIFSSQTDATPSFSPDGSRIAFQSTRSGSGNIWVCDADGSNLRQLTFFESHTGTPRWSPDGRQIVFDSLQTSSWDVYVVDAERGVPKRMTVEPSDDGTASWSRDGRWIYFHSDRGGSGVELWKMPAEGGGEPVQVTQNGGFYGLESWDGRDLFYVKGHSDTGLWRMPVGGGEEVEVLAEPLKWWAEWDLARGAVYFSREEGHGPARVYTINRLDLGSGEITEMLRREGALDQLWLAVSADETSILFGETPSWQSELILMENFR